MKHFRKTVRWFLYTVCIAIVPLLFTIINLATYSKPWTLSAITEHGEMLLIATALGAGAIGEMFTSKKHPLSFSQEICVGATLILVIISSMWFASIAAGYGGINQDVVSYGSLTVLVCVVCSGGGCVYLSEM